MFLDTKRKGKRLDEVAEGISWVFICSKFLDGCNLV